MTHFALAEQAVSTPFFVSLTVFLELGWVIVTRAGQSRQRVAAAMQTILDLETAHFDDAAAIGWAIARFRGGADWGDMLHILGPWVPRTSS